MTHVKYHITNLKDKYLPFTPFPDWNITFYEYNNKDISCYIILPLTEEQEFLTRMNNAIYWYPQMSDIILERMFETDNVIDTNVDGYKKWRMQKFKERLAQKLAKSEKFEKMLEDEMKNYP